MNLTYEEITHCVTNPYKVKNSLCSKDAQLAERKLLLCSPLARGDCVNTQSIFMNKTKEF